MGKLLSLVIIIALIYFFIVPKFRTKKDKNNSNKSENFVLCDCCGAFVSEDEITKKDKKQICVSCEKEKV